ncbi:metalloregulator ArsR/SmtB family transcription factor [Mycobacteroides abscessus]|uniref:metalloregulator ArsR/SmtB family transcription factor n=1 Tax=Mycobacteroides abscessus TaxID=36809 RepID=UPI000925F8F0|nr:metalloregulator ArsR/SmtB family transcription factor [Mycobacteroides abscessus]MDO3333526.1 metalloregulator ArsR/SmtB family transcription factor [Mycobacteroides abscessus subsp. bolletii]QSM87218.1 metalloregulator ArsR/SmtB family transcription factor [Mycobacteroides abscessus subsp. bolletii]SIB76155.1 ArsR family transcriptional regulator [Mycobacteroides abscessus subsp. bolletii]SIJ31541.1 ArsR family transcriptional regulator [Mycobacteroides abscessus subsp. bolletii]SKS97296.
MTSTLRRSLHDQVAQVGKGLANGKRLEILELLTQAERSVETIAGLTGLSITSTSSHLQILKHAGLVTTRRDGVKIYYRISGPEVAALLVATQAVANQYIAAATEAARSLLGDDVEAIGPDELVARTQNEEVILIDVRPREEFEAGHLTGAVNIPLDELNDSLQDLPATANIVAYCRGRYCALAPAAARMLASHKREAAYLTEGMLEWNARQR